MPGEQLLYSCKANAIVVPSEYGLPRFPANGLLPLVGLAGKEAIGGHLHVTTFRVVFTAHAFNRLRGSVSTPLTIIHQVCPWRSRLAMGVEINTATELHRYVTWSKAKLVNTINKARRAVIPE